jgi:hypothetical protein
MTPFSASRTGSGINIAGFLAFGTIRASKKALLYVKDFQAASAPDS